ncbi:DNA-directed RNA polymerase III subunit 2-like isoform X1 [Gossypium arboreum]|uniref:DNA-directed RNA polymerase III subunit 2-like isoform X1 n=1 Tax=Gossypium arboreum TaxID=29729 RepID=UPI0022F1C644|nr:DNA-directed RNA polymerase III subunit 2-like isoform X1 [Gossypium arboreum]
MYRKKEFSFFLWKTHQLNVSELPVDKQKLTAPIKSTADKFQLLPEFLKVRGLMKQQLDSFDYFVNIGIKKIVRVNDRIVSDIDPSIYLRYSAPIFVNGEYFQVRYGQKTRLEKVYSRCFFDVCMMQNDRCFGCNAKSVPSRIILLLQKCPSC